MAAVSAHTVILDFGVEWGEDCSPFAIEEGATVQALQKHIFSIKKYSADQQILTAEYWDDRIEQLDNPNTPLAQVVKNIYRIRVELRVECYGCGCFG